MTNICQKHVDKGKQSELERHLNSYSVTFDDLLSLIGKGIQNVVKEGNKPRMKNAFRQGLYLGCPGKDIYIALMKMDLSDEQIRSIAAALAKAFPATPPGGHVHTAACVRYIYGCFDKQGCLLSKKHQSMMSRDQDDWSISAHFMELVAKEFERIGNRYGLVIYYEMKAHRLGDKAVLANDPSYLTPMLECYLESQRQAKEIKCYKQMFTPFYWAAKYFQKFDAKKAIEYHVKSLNHMEKFCPDARPGYRDKALDSMKYLRKRMNPVEWASYKRKIRKFRNKCLAKVKGSVLK